MKKLFTLLVGALFAGNAFGQATWTTIFNQDMENGFEDPNMEFFECSERHNAARGPVRVVEDPADPTNHCIKVIVRSDAEATEEGDYSTENGANGAHLISWDTQFFIYFKEAIPEGKEIRLTMNAKGEKNGSFQFQTHEYPQNYIYYTLFPGAADGGNVLSYTTEWAAKPVKKQDIVSHDASPTGNFQCIALNMTCDPYDGNVVYLDNIKVEIRDQKPVDPTLESTFIDFLKGKGTMAEEVFEMNNRTYTTYTARDYVTGNDVKAEVVNDPLDGKPALKVTAPDLTEVPDLDADGNEQYTTNEETGEQILKTKKVYLRTLKDQEGNDSIVQVASDDWLCQFFVTVGHKFQKSEKYRIKFSARADKAASFDTQAHTFPGGYQHWACIGSQDLTPEWKEFNIGYDADATIPGDAGGKNCQTVAFNLYKLKEANTYYFRFEEFAFTAAKVTDEDRTIGKGEFTIQADNSEGGVSTKVDLADMLSAFGEENFKFAEKYESGDGLKFQVYEAPEEEGDDPNIHFSAARSFSNGGFVNAVDADNSEQAYEVDGEYVRGINITLNEDEIEGSIVPFDVWTDPDANITFGGGKTLKTKLCFAKGGWYYVYDVTMMSPEDYKAAGIAPVKAQKAGNGLIYNLAGQRVDASYKGLVIKNGKKLIQK